jgi:FKBP-type peptidyl-prolyl cis-trans isomerase FkpA
MRNHFAFEVPMNVKFSLIAACIAIASLSACGGASDAPVIPAESPAAASKIENVVGTGAVAAAGKVVRVHYTGWLYTASVSNNKGAQFDSSAGKPALEFKLANNEVITGFDQGVTGMKVGGKRTIIMPASQAYGAAGRPGIPPNSGLVFDVELLEVK